MSVIIAAASVAADGPVDTVSGVTVTDNDNGNGQRARRAGGQTFVFTVSSTAAFATLNWGIKAGSTPGIAFDGAINQPGETLALDPASLPSGSAVWNGHAVVPVWNGSQYVGVDVPTRFILTVRNAENALVPLSNFPDGAAPGIDVKTIGATFTANVRFEMMWNGNFHPLLDMYDSLATPPGGPPSGPGPVMSEWERAFYFTNAGMTIEQHDQNEITRFNALKSDIGSVKGDTAFLRIDTPNRLGMLSTDVNLVKTTVNNINTMLQNQGPIQLPPDLAKQSDVHGAKNDLMNTLMLLFGVMPCESLPPEEQGMCEAVKKVSDLSTQASVDELSGKMNGLASQTSVNQLGGQLNGLGLSLGQLDGKVDSRASQSSVDGLGEQLDGLATQTTVNQLREQMNNLQSSIGELQSALSASPRLEIEIVELSEPTTPKRRRWLVRTSRNGAPAAAELFGLHAISSPKLEPAVANDVTAMATVHQLLPGLMEVVLEVGSPSLADVAFHFSVRHSLGGEVLEAQSLVGDVRR